MEQMSMEQWRELCESLANVAENPYDDIDATKLAGREMLRKFCQAFREKVNHPFLDGGEEFDIDKTKWRDWIEDRGGVGGVGGTHPHSGHLFFDKDGKDVWVRLRVENLTAHANAIAWFNDRLYGLETILRAVLRYALVDEITDASMDALYQSIRTIQSAGTLFRVFERDDVWNYAVPNIVIEMA